MSLLTIVPKVEIKKGFNITYLTGHEEIIHADSFGITEDLKDFITFYNSDKDNEELVCMIKIDNIIKITLVEIKDESQ